MRKKYSNDKGELTLTAKVLLLLFEGVNMLPRPFESKTNYVRRIFSGKVDYGVYLTLLLRLERRGLIRILKDKKGKPFELTKEGVLKALFLKARMPVRGPWDGKWRMLVFDIPERARKYRDELRLLLKQNGFKQVQQSVFLCPWPLNPAAVQYVKETGLDKYIRFFRIDKVDDEHSLRKYFVL